MSDPLATALARLAPAVDLGASRELFERARDGGTEIAGPAPRPTRWLLAAACVLLLVAGLAGVWAIAGRDEPDPVGRPTVAVPGDGTEFEVVAVEPVTEAGARSIQAAGTYVDLVSIASRFGPQFAPFANEIDFDTQIAVVIERIGGFSPDELARFDTTGDAWIAAFRPPGGDREDIGIGYAYLVAIERSALTGIDWLVLPGEIRGTTTLEEVRVAVPRTLEEVVDDADYDWGCAGPTGSSFTMTIALATAVELRVDVVDDDALLGTGTLGSSRAGPFTLEFSLTAPPSATAEAVVNDVVTGAEVARRPLAGLDIPDCG